MEDISNKVLKVLDDIKTSIENNSNDAEEIKRIESIKDYINNYKNESSVNSLFDS